MAEADAHDDVRRERPDLERRVVRPADRPRDHLGFNTDFDPAIGLFNTTNFPGASTAKLTAARDTYAVLTGRVTSVTSQAVLDAPRASTWSSRPSSSAGGIKVYGMFAQDSWKLRPNLTLTGGIRYDVQTPFIAVQQRHVVGDDGERLRPVGPGRRRSLQQVQLPQPQCRRAAPCRSSSS